jgi:hypothetical protein
MSEKPTIIVITFLYFDSGKDEPGMKLQVFERGVWVDYKVNRRLAKSPVDIDKLPAGL